LEAHVVLLLALENFSRGKSAEKAAFAGLITNTDKPHMPTTTDDCKCQERRFLKDFNGKEVGEVKLNKCGSE